MEKKLHIRVPHPCDRHCFSIWVSFATHGTCIGVRDCDLDLYRANQSQSPTYGNEWDSPSSVVVRDVQDIHLGSAAMTKALAVCSPIVNGARYFIIVTGDEELRLKESQ